MRVLDVVGRASWGRKHPLANSSGQIRGRGPVTLENCGERTADRKLRGYADLGFLDEAEEAQSLVSAASWNNRAAEPTPMHGQILERSAPDASECYLIWVMRSNRGAGNSTAGVRDEDDDAHHGVDDDEAASWWFMVEDLCLEIAWAEGRNGERSTVGNTGQG